MNFKTFRNSQKKSSIPFENNLIKSFNKSFQNRSPHNSPLSKEIEKSGAKKSIINRLSFLIGVDDFLRKKTRNLGKRKGFNIQIINKDTFQSSVWKKNFFIICFFVTKFTSILKFNLRSIKFKKLNQTHFEILADKSHAYKELKNLNLNDELASEYTKIIESSHTNELLIKFKIFKFCKKQKILL